MFSIKASIKISNYLKKIGANVTISNSANAGLHSRIANLFYKNRCIYVSHGWSCIYNGGRFKFIFAILKDYYLILLTLSYVFLKKTLIMQKI